MISAAQRLWHTASPDLKLRLVAVYGTLAVLNIGGLLAILFAARSYPLLLGLGLTAYGFGLRHAVDPDHIAAIDNTTRKLMQDGKRPVAVGFFFSFGHSTVVMLLSILLAVSARLIKQHLSELQSVGGVIGTAVSGLFLILIAIINMVVLADIVAAWKHAVDDGIYDDRTLDMHLANRGFFSRLLRPLLRLVGDSWAMYPIGFLFGLGFDTASEVGLLSMAAVTGASGVPIGYVLLLPILFAAGMSLVDTSDGVAMLGAYGWAVLRPIRKLYYNITITSVSILIALLVGGVEMLQLIGQETEARGAVWDKLQGIPLANMGFYIIAIFMVSWLISLLIYRIHRVDDLDAALAARRRASLD